MRLEAEECCHQSNGMIGISIQTKWNGVSDQTNLKKRIYAPSSSPKLESSIVATFIPFLLARERQFAAISAKLLSANWTMVSFSAEWMTGNRRKSTAESGVFTVELEFVEKERRLRGV